MSDDIDLAEKLKSLDDAQLGFIAARVLEKLTADTLPPDDDDDEAAEDAALVSSAADQLEVAPETGAPGLAPMLVAAAETSPELREVIVKALARADEPDMRLGPLTFTVAAIALAIAGAILRPKVVSESETKADGGAKKKFAFEFQGVPNIVQVITAALPFL